VEQGLLVDRARDLIEAFTVSIRLRRPFIRLKWAQSLDGRLACRGGASRWITNEQARGFGHQLRGMNDAVMIGAGTLRTDDPELTVRSAPKDPGLELRQPLRVVLAGSSPLPLQARLFAQGLRGRTLVMAASGSQPLAQCLSAGIPVREVAADDEGLPDPAESLRVLYAEGIGSVLVEGGSRLLTRLLAEGLWDALTVFTAPLILGQGIEAVGDLGILTPGDGIRLQGPRLQAFEGFTRLDARNPATSVDVPTPVKEGACLQD
jgi:riboflavin-specific deaminase-like protein